MAVKINFRPSSSVRPNLTSTRAGDKIEFIDIKAALEGKESEKVETETLWMTRRHKSGLHRKEVLKK